MRNNNQKQPARGRPAPSSQGALAWWPVLIAIALVAGAFWLLNAHLRASNVAPSPAPSVFASMHIPSQGHQGHARGDAKRFAHFHYSSDPPTSGFHLEVFSKGLINDASLPLFVQVHLLEHGNILLQYNCLCPDTVNTLTEIANEYNSRLLPAGVTLPTTLQVEQAEENGLAVVVAPYPHMKHTIALTAWTRLATMETPDRADIISFINRWLRDPDNLQQ